MFYKRNWIKETQTDVDSTDTTKVHENTWYSQLRFSPINHVATRFRFEEGTTKDNRAQLPWHQSQIGRTFETEATVDAIKEAGLKTKTIIGGAPVTDAYAKQIGADGFSDNAPGAVDLIRQLVGA